MGGEGRHRGVGELKMEMLHEPEFWVAVGFVLVIALLVWKGVPGMVDGRGHAAPPP